MLNYTVAIVEHLRGENMIKNAILMSMLFLMLGFSGCLGDDTAEPIMNEQPIMTLTENYTQSYQFNNLAPMGMGFDNSTAWNNTNMSVHVNITMNSGFHEPVLWDQGFVNVSVVDENSTVLWTNQSNGGQHYFNLTISDNYTHTGNLTFRVLAEGSDNATDEQVADWFVVRYDVYCEWRVA